MKNFDTKFETKLMRFLVSLSLSFLLCNFQTGRKTTVSKYEKAYKKPIPKNYILTTGNHSQEDSLDNANKILTLGPGSVSSFG